MGKILFLISGMGSGGAERVMGLLLNHSACSNNETAVALLSYDNNCAYEIDTRVKFFSLCKNLSGNRLKAGFSRLIRLRKLIKEYRPDVVVSFLTICNIYTCIAGAGLGVPVIVSERNDPVLDCPSKLKRFVRNTAYRLADGFIFQTENARDHFCKAIQKKAVVIPNPVKDDLPVAELGCREKTVVAAGRLSKQKNYPMMLDAFSKFLVLHPEYTLQIFGKGEDEASLKDYARAVGIADRVEFMGVASDLHDRIKRAGMFVLSSDYEGISNSLLEAMSMGLPCVSTDCPCGGSRHLIEDGVNGLLTPVGDAEAFAEAMGRIADSDEFAKRLGHNAKETRNTHSVAVILEQYFGFIENVLSRA